MQQLFEVLIVIFYIELLNPLTFLYLAKYKNMFRIQKAYPEHVFINELNCFAFYFLVNGDNLLQLNQVEDPLQITAIYIDNAQFSLVFA